MTGCFEARRVWKVYGKTVALADVTLALCRGLNVIVGPNGSGKSTLLRLWAGLARPSEGEVLSLGLDPWGRRELLMRRISVGFESTRLPPWMRGFDVIAYFAEQYGFDPQEPVRIAEFLGLKREDLRRRVHGYSMGMRKKLLLSIALRSGPEAYLLDEPYTLLDPQTRRRLDEIIRERARTATVIVASHFSTRTLQLADRLVRMESGRVAGFLERKPPARAYSCETGAGGLEPLIQTGPARLIYNGKEALIVYREPREPPTPECQPILLPESAY